MTDIRDAIDAVRRTKIRVSSSGHSYRFRIQAGIA